MSGIKLNDFERELFEEHAAADGVAGLTSWMKQVCIQYCMSKNESGPLTDKRLEDQLKAHRDWERSRFREIMEKLEQWDG